MNQRRRAGWIWVAVVFVVGAIALGLLLPSSKPVPVIGDSITVMSEKRINDKLDGSDGADVRARIGARIDEMLPALRDALRAKPDAVVVNLGTNDVLQAQNHPDWQTGFLQMIQMVEDVDCVVIVNINTMVNGATARPEVAGEINAAIVQASAAHDNIRVLDWNGIVHRAEGSEFLLPDKVHPSPQGSQWLASEIGHMVERGCSTAAS